MKNLRKAIMGAAVLVLLTGCSSMKKVDYAKFHEEALAAAEARETCGLSKVVVKGTVTSEGQEIKIDSTLGAENGVLNGEGVEDMYDLVAAMIASTTAESVPEAGENEGVTYYCGGGFKYEQKLDDLKGTAVFNKYGLLTSMTSSEGNNKSNIKLTWSK